MTTLVVCIRVVCISVCMCTCACEPTCECCFRRGRGLEVEGYIPGGGSLIQDASSQEKRGEVGGGARSKIMNFKGMLFMYDP